MEDGVFRQNSISSSKMAPFEEANEYCGILGW